MHISLLRLTAHVCVCDVLPFPPRRTKRQTIRSSYDRRLYSHPRPARLHVCTLCILQPPGKAHTHARLGLPVLLERER